MFKYAVLSTAVFSSFTYASNAGAISPPSASIEKISVYASRQAKPLQDVNASVTVFNRADIELLQPKDLTALLQLVPGIQIARTGSRGQTSSILIRGSRTQHALVLIDGVRTGSATLGYQDLAFLPIDLIEKVEVIRGARAAHHGSDAISGVIAITTRQVDRTELHAKTGSHGLAETSVHSQTSLAKTQVFASVGYSRADGIHVLEKADPDRDGFNQRYVRIGASQDTAIGQFFYRSQLNRSFNEYDANPVWGGSDEAKTQQDLHQLSWQLAQSLSGERQLNQQAHLAISRDDSLNFGNNSRPSQFETNRKEFDYQSHLTLDANVSLLAGMTQVHEDVFSPTTKFVNTDRRHQALFTGADVQFGDLSTELIVRHDRVSSYRSNNSYQWGLAYQLIDSLQLRFNQGSGFKVPTFNDLYWPGFGNANLLPEESLSREIGLRYQGEFQIDAVHFQRDLTNMIVYNGQARQSQNIGFAKVHGFEYSFSRSWANIHHQIDLTYTHAEDLTNRRTVPNIPKHKITYLASYQQGDWLWTGRLQQRGRVDNSLDRQANLSPILLLSAGVSYDMTPALKIRFNLENLLNKTYQTQVGYLQPGREFSLAVQWLAW